MPASMMGVAITSDWQWNNYTRWSLFLLILACTSMTYTLTIVYNSLKVVELIAGIGLVLTSVTKFSTHVVWFSKEIYAFTAFGFHLCEQNSSGNTAGIMSDVVDKIYLHVKLIASGFVFGLAIYAIYPFYDFIFNGAYTLVGPQYLPYVDEETLTGYLTIMAYCIYISCYGVVGSLIFSSMFVLFTDLYAGMVSLVQDDFRELDIMLEKNENIDLRFKNILLKLMDALNFSKMMNNIYSIAATAQAVASYSGIIGSIFGFLVNNWIGGIGAAVYFLTELMMFCIIGTYLQSSTERMCEVIYNAKWYLYEVKHQKDIMFALKMFQDVKPIMIAKLYAMNVETGKKIINNIYSILMVMLSFS